MNGKAIPVAKKFRETKLFPAAIPSLKFPFCQKACQKIKIATVIRVKSILSYILNNFNKKIQKNTIFLFICLYFNKYNAEKRHYIAKNAVILQSIFI